MELRTRKILEAIVREHVSTGEPVGSSHLVDKYKLDVSPATVRNVMAQLEDEGYIVQPHTSAGRVPTEKAYKELVSEFFGGKKAKKLKDREQEDLDVAMATEGEQACKQTAKALAEICEAAVFWAMHKNNLYYTGLSKLLAQPEFERQGLVYNVSAIIDRMDDIISNIFDDVAEEPKILVGSDNPFGDFVSAVMVKYRRGNQSGLFGILSPIRADYEKNLAAVEYVLKKLKK
jgi:transcriptional regulator of heat shock response